MKRRPGPTCFSLDVNLSFRARGTHTRTHASTLEKEDRGGSRARGDNFRPGKWQKSPPYSAAAAAQSRTDPADVVVHAASLSPSLPLSLSSLLEADVIFSLVLLRSSLSLSHTHTHSISRERQERAPMQLLDKSLPSSPRRHPAGDERGREVF